MKLASETYRVTANFPRHELYGLSQQMRRAAVSVPSNIAEGKGHRSDKGFSIFLFHARGSLLEHETQVEIGKDLQYLQEEQAQRLLGRTKTVGRSLTGLINSLSTREQRSQSVLPRTNERRPTTDFGSADDRRPTTDD